MLQTKNQIQKHQYRRKLNFHVVQYPLGPKMKVTNTHEESVRSYNNSL
jgi:hypothetical protein